MKTKNLFATTGLATAVISTLFFWGCKKTEVDTDTSVASDNAESEFVYSDASNIIDDAARNEDGFNKNDYTPWYASASCKPNIDKSFLTDANGDTTTRTMICDWGASGCLGDDGRFRKGSITAVFTGKINSGSVAPTITITFNAYSVNNRTLEGTVVVEFLGYNDKKMTVKNGKVTRPDGKSHTINSEIKWDCVFDDNNFKPNPYNDREYAISITATGTAVNGKTYSVATTTPLKVLPPYNATLKPKGCKHIVSGTIEIVPEGKPARVLDFGDGTCDDKATVTINGNVFNITLP